MTTPVAQLIERLATDQEVLGSNPSRRTNYSLIFFAILLNIPYEIFIKFILTKIVIYFFLYYNTNFISAYFYIIDKQL